MVITIGSLPSISITMAKAYHNLKSTRIISKRWRALKTTLTRTTTKKLKVWVKKKIRVMTPKATQSNKRITSCNLTI